MKTCTHCGKLFDPEELTDHGTARLCFDCLRFICPPKYDAESIDRLMYVHLPMARELLRGLGESEQLRGSAVLLQQLGRGFTELAKLMDGLKAAGIFPLADNLLRQADDPSWAYSPKAKP